MTRQSFIAGSFIVTQAKLDSHSSTDWQIDALSSLMITFQRDGSKIIEKDSPGLLN